MEGVVYQLFFVLSGNSKRNLGRGGGNMENKYFK